MKLLALTKAGLAGNTIFSRGWLADMRERKQGWIVVVAIVGVLSAVGSMGFLLIQNYLGLIGIGLASGYPELVIFAGLTTSVGLSFLLSIPVAMSILYFSKDGVLLATLPTRPWQVVVSKMLVIMVSSMLVHLFVFIPAAMIYVVYVGPTVPNIVVLLAYSLFAPALPVSVAVLFVYILMKLVNLSRFRTLLEVIGSMVAIAVILLFQVAVQRGVESAGMADIARLVRGMMDGMPPLAFAAEAVVAGGHWKALVALLVVAAVAGVVAVMVQSSYLADLSRRSESSGRHEKVDYGRLSRPMGKIGAIVRREWSIITSSSSYIVEAAGEVLIFPILLLVFSFTSSQTAELQQVMDMAAALPELPLYVFAGLTLMLCINMVAPTSLSREGRKVDLSLLLPLPGRAHIKGKLAFQLMLFVPSLLLNTAIVVFALGISAVHLSYMIPGGVLFIALFFFLGVLLDVRSPMLKWSHPQQAMKQNTNGLASMGLSLLVVGVFAGLGWLLLSLELALVQIGLIVVLGAAIALVLIGPAVYRLADRRYAEAFGR